jgi:hypothetical protein
MESPDVFTQEELDAVLAAGDVIPVCAGEGEFAVSGSAHVRAADTARVTARDQAVVEAGGEANVRASGSATVLAKDHVIVEAGDEVSVRAGNQSIVRATGSAYVLLSAQATGEGSDHVRIAARGQSTMTAFDFSSVRAYERARVAAHGEATVHAWGSARVDAYERASVSAWGSARVSALGESRVEARESCFVEAGGNAHVRAFGASIVRARGGATIDALDHVSVTVHGTTPTVNGGNVTRAPAPQTAQEWCDLYGVEVNDGVATLYKAVDGEFNSYHGMSYLPGTQPQAPDWDGGEEECGGGIHLSPRPGLALPRTYGALRFVACPVRVADIVTHPAGFYPDTVKAPGVCAPVYEVDELGRPIS